MGSRTELKGAYADREKLTDQQSGPRASMVGGHMKSAAPPDHPQPTIHFTGADVNYHDFVFNDIVEDSGTVYSYNHRGVQKRAVFTRYSRPDIMTPLEHAIFFKRSELSPSMLNKPVIDVAEVNFYTNHDNVFSSTKFATQKLRDIIRGNTNYVEKDDMLNTMLCQKDGEFVDGVNLTTVCISHADIIEDAYTISQYAADQMHSYGLKIIDKTVRRNELLLDIYGKDTPMGRQPQYFPNVGEAVRDDGLVIATREFDPLYAAIDCSAGELQHISPFYDDGEYVDADPKHYHNPSEDNGSRVVDIQVWRNETAINNGVNDIEVSEENKRILDQYAIAQKNYYQEILRFYFSVNEDVVWAPKALLLIERAMASDSHEVFPEFREKILAEIEKLVRQGALTREQVGTRALARLSSPVDRVLNDPIDTYTIRIVVRYPIPVTVSTKITDRSGTKGVIGAVLPTERMPLDEFGRRIHVLRSMNAVPRRSTFSALFHIYWSDASEQLKLRLKPMLDDGKINQAWDMMMDYLCRYNPDWANMLNQSHPNHEDKVKLFKEIYDFTIRIWLPHELEKSPIDIVHSLGEYKPKKSRLLITNYQGEQEWTKNTFYVGYVETLRLDKTGREFSSISSMYTNFLGMIDATNQGRGSYPINHSSKKWGSESEHRLCDGYGPGMFDEIHNRSNAPDVHRALVRGLLESTTPSNPGYLIDRNKYPLGESQVDRMIYNVHRCEGFVLVRPKREDV